MEKKEIQIPEGCKKIQIDIENNVMTVLYEPKTNNKSFECPETGEVEARPGEGDFCIFWVRNYRGRAVCANFVKRNEKGWYCATDGAWYEEAIKFRNYEQYLRVKGGYVE